MFFLFHLFAFLITFQPKDSVVNNNANIANKTKDTIASRIDTSFLSAQKNNVIDSNITLAKDTTIIIKDSGVAAIIETAKPIFKTKAQLDSLDKEYISKYASIAMAEMIRTGVPASIKLAQGIIETDAGKSELVIRSKNHFGLKCKKNWTGDTVLYDDDAKGECFRKYNDDSISFVDQSNFLRESKRYAALFKLDPLNYREWAKGLKQAGYATNTKYTTMLIKKIEEWGLQEYSLKALLKNKIIDSAQYNTQFAQLICKKCNADSAKQNMIALSDDTSKPNKILLLDKLTLNAPVKTPLAAAALPTSNEDDLLSSRLKNQQDTSQFRKEITKELNSIAENNLQEEKRLENLPALTTTLLTSPLNINTTPTSNEKLASLVSKDLLDTFTYTLSIVNKSKAVKVKKGTSLLAIALRYRIPLMALLEYNDLPEYVNVVTKTQFVFLEKKLLRGSKDVHIVNKNETLYDIAQMEGVQLTSLRNKNYLPNGIEPKQGEKIYLIYNAPIRPKTLN